MPLHCHFYGLEARWLSWDRFYKIHVLDDRIVGAYLAGQVYDEVSGRVQLIGPAGLLGPLMALWVRRIVRGRVEREAQCDGLDPKSLEFQERDRRNFVWPRDDIEQVVLSRRRALWTGGAPNSGSFQVALRFGGKRQFVVVGDQNIDDAERAFARLLGTDRVVTKHARRAESNARRDGDDGRGAR
jgi:hypothetical protein